VLNAKKICFKVGDKTLLHQTSVHFSAGGFHVIMGANGAGKSTLLKILSGESKPSSGEVYLDGMDLRGYSKNSLATRRAVLSQHYHLAFPITVEEIVLMGRYPYFATKPSAKDKAVCTEAVKVMDVAHLLQRDYTTLSGGEAQKVQMSRVLSQIWSEEEAEGRLLFLDEPVSHLDVKYQHQLMKVAKDFCRKGTTVIAVLHDINLAIAFADRLLFMKDGSVLYDVDDAAELTPALLFNTFGLLPSMVHVAGKDKPFVLF
jgi:iron complex transport system ATP-binding protein